jgi:UDP-2,3-diacylglucosamine hydrolase
VVVADAHLGAPGAGDDDAFLHFLDGVPLLGDSLLLAGDIYDFWFTYPRLIPRHCIRVTARIVELARTMPVLMLGGNHDRWGDNFWGPETGVRFDPRQLRFAVGRREILAVHGDGLHDERRSATVLNHLLDAPAVIALFATLPPWLGFRIARRFGHDPVFAAAHPEIVATAAERQERWASRALAEDASIDTVIMGHTHRAVLAETAPDRWYLNPGPWLRERRYATLTDQLITLHRYGSTTTSPA